MSSRFVKMSAGVVSLSITAAAGAALPFDPWQFNVYSLGNIGTSSASAYGSDFQGIGGAAGSAYFSGFSLHDVGSAGPGTPYSGYFGGDLYIAGAINNGGVEAGGNVTVQHSSVQGAIKAGGNLYGPSGTVNGNVTLGGLNLANVPSLTINGTVTENAGYAPSLNLSEVSGYFSAAKNVIAGATPNAQANLSLSFGAYTLNAVPGINVVDLAANDLLNAHTFNVNGPASASVIVRVLGTNATLDSTTWTYSGGVSSERTLLAYTQATSLNLSSGNIVNILAPMADTHFSSGLVVGNLIVGNLTGGGQVNVGFYGGDLPDTVPAPGAAGLLAGAGLLAMRRRR